MMSFQNEVQQFRYLGEFPPKKQKTIQEFQMSIGSMALNRRDVIGATVVSVSLGRMATSEITLPEMKTYALISVGR
jgi:hypothetical protein